MQRQPAMGLGLCHNANETEMVRLSEEQENHLIMYSVRLNFEKKTIDYTLPVQGDEKEFLSPNKDIATSVLGGKCMKYGGNEEGILKWM